MGVSIKTFKHETFGNVRCYIDKNGTAFFNAEDVARGLGFVDFQKKDFATSGEKNPNGLPNDNASSATGGRKTYEVIRWARINKYLKEFGYKKTVNKNNYLPENLVYRLAMKANNAAAKNFQGWLADDVVPTIRKTGSYTLPYGDPVAPADIVPLTYNGERVLTNRQIAEVFSVTEKSIVHAYNRHKSALAKDIDYYDLRGTAFNNFKAENLVDAADGMTAGITETANGTTKTAAYYIQGSVLKIWTKSGVFKISKFIHTDDVKEIYDAVAKVYFDITAEYLPPPKQAKDTGASVYAFEMSNGTVKIGMSNNVPYRVKAVEYESHLKVVNTFYVTLDSRKKASDVESALHKYFEPQCSQGEFFLSLTQFLGAATVCT